MARVRVRVNFIEDSISLRMNLCGYAPDAFYWLFAKSRAIA